MKDNKKLLSKIKTLKWNKNNYNKLNIKNNKRMNKN